MHLQTIIQISMISVKLDNPAFLTYTFCAVTLSCIRKIVLPNTSNKQSNKLLYLKQINKTSLILMNNSTCVSIWIH